MFYNGQSPNRVEPLERRRLLSIVPVGGEFRANDFTSGEQHFPAVAMDADGDFIVAWHSYWETVPGAQRDVQARRFDAGGKPLANHFVANTFLTANQTYADVAMDDAGNAVVAWFGSSAPPGPSQDVVARRVDAAGNPIGPEFRVSSSGGGEHPRVAMNGDGEFVVTWYSGGSNNYEVHARRFAADGTPQGAQFHVNTYTTGQQFHPAVAMAEDGSFTIAYPSDGEIRAQRFDASGLRAGDEVLVNTYTTGSHLAADVAYDADGDFVITWSSYEQDGAGWGMYGQRFADDGARLGGEFLINEHTSSGENSARVVYEPGGGFLAVWHTPQRTDGADTYARRFRADGTPRGGEWRVNTFLGLKATNPDVAIDDAGKLVVVWHSWEQDGSAWGVYGQRYEIQPPTVSAASFAYATAPHSVRFTLDGNLSASTFDAKDLVLHNLTTGQTIPAADVGVGFDAATNVATFTYLAPGGVLPDGRYRATLLAAGVEDDGGDPLPADHTFEFTFLRGDANGDGAVNLSDFNILAANFGQSPRDFTQGDFDYSGNVNLSDFNLLAARFGTVLSSVAARNVSDRDDDDDATDEDDALASL
jgi:hypothetical protein